MLKLYNTLTRKKEEFKPINKGKVGMYSCGPTVYWYQHIGNMRAYLFEDTLKRVLLYNKYKVKNIINITDVGHLTSDADEGDDKMEKASIKEGKSAKEIAEYYFDAFHEDLKKLNILEPSKWTKATEHIEEQIELIKTLEKKGYTYLTNDGVYFNTKKFKDYSKFARLNVEGLEAGKRIDLGDKKNKTDFALWKFSGQTKRQQEWESPWGVGFPGWHIECSAMSMKYLGKHFDIHTGGIDHIPIHHTNEIAQSECATGKKFVNYWLHNDFLLFKGEKVSKSKGGLYTISELEELGYKAEHYRYLFLLTQYNRPLNFTLENLDAARTAFERIKRKIIELKELKIKGKDNTKTYEKEFLEAINDDLNMPRAIQTFIKALDDLDFDSKKKLKLIEKFDKVLGLGIDKIKEDKLDIPKEIKTMAEDREKLRREKKWAESDILRNRIKEFGYNILDESNGYKLEKI